MSGVCTHWDSWQVRSDQMRRWNGWGEAAVTYPLPHMAAQLLAEVLGDLTPYPDAAIEDVLDSVPASRLSPHPLIDDDPALRLFHTRGQSLPDWIALRSGRIAVFPDGVAIPASAQEVRALLAYAARTGTRLIPYGGGTSVVGHINPLPGESPVLTVDLWRLNRLQSLDETSGLATFEAGIRGPHLERLLNSRGFTLGHFPQSFEFSTLGGWIATRSSGQQSYHYGRIEDLFAGGRVETPRGSLVLPPHPASAAGPDLRQFVLGSEGRLGVITEAVMRIRPRPETEEFHGVFFKNWESGSLALKAAAQNDLPVSMLRLSDPLETETTLALSGKDRLVAWANQGLRLLGFGGERCLLIYGLTGNRRYVRAARRRANAFWRAHGGMPTGTFIGRVWQKGRFHTPYLRNTLWSQGVALDTLETALPWGQVQPAAGAIMATIRAVLAESGERVLAFAHLSHVYRDGASIYITYLFRRTADPDEDLDRWRRVKAAASRTVLSYGGTISHQHGVGQDHAPYLPEEKGTLGMDHLKAGCRNLDPDGIMNPGKLFVD